MVIKQKTPSVSKLFFLFCICFFAVANAALGQAQTLPDWQSYNLPFRVLNIASSGQRLWVCGTDESIAVSSDNGAHWQVKHQIADGAVLLTIDFADSKFGYAAGTGGVILTSLDGGETWSRHSGISETILQTSFADPQQGLVRTPSSLLFTVDGGTRWSPISGAGNLDVVKEFPFTFALVALDSTHMAVMLKQGAEQYEPQAFLFTQDSGKSWKSLNIPNVTLYSFLRVGGRYWAVGTEVIHKEQQGGGYSAPVALSSSDGENWSHSTGDLSACKLEMCTVCNAQGCFFSNGGIAQVFSDKTTYGAFPPSKELTAKWASTDSAICFVASHLQCASLKELPEALKSAASPVPTVVAPGRFGAPIPQGPQCIICGFDRIFIDNKVQGTYKVKLVLGIGKNGTVMSAEAQRAPTVEVKSRIEEQSQQWIFEPYLKDGIPVSVKLNTNLNVQIIKAR